MNEAMVLTTLNIVLEGLRLWRVVGGDVRGLTTMLVTAVEEDRDLTEEELASVRAKAIADVQNL